MKGSSDYISWALEPKKAWEGVCETGGWCWAARIMVVEMTNIFYDSLEGLYWCCVDPVFLEEGRRQTGVPALLLWAMEIWASGLIFLNLNFHISKMRIIRSLDLSSPTSQSDGSTEWCRQMFLVSKKFLSSSLTPISFFISFFPLLSVKLFHGPLQPKIIFEPFPWMTLNGIMPLWLNKSPSPGLKNP